MRIVPRLWLWIHAAVIALSLTASASASTIETLAPSGADPTTPGAINARGEVVGYFFSGGHFHGFLWSKGKYTVIDVPGALDTQLTGLNDRGDIVGATGAGGFLLRDGQVTALRTGPNGEALRPLAINNRGDIVGTFGAIVPQFHREGFLLDAQGTFQTGRTSLDRDYSGINDSQEIVGSIGNSFLHQGFLIDRRGTTTDISLGGGIQQGISTLPSGINARGDIAGTARTPSVLPDRGFVRDRDGSIEYIAIPNAFHTRVTGINARGDLVGWYQDSTGTHGFVLTR